MRHWRLDYKISSMEQDLYIDQKEKKIPNQIPSAIVVRCMHTARTQSTPPSGVEVDRQHRASRAPTEPERRQQPPEPTARLAGTAVGDDVAAALGRGSCSAAQPNCWR